MLSRLLKNSDGDREASPIEVIKSLPGQLSSISGHMPRSCFPSVKP